MVTEDVPVQTLRPERRPLSAPVAPPTLEWKTPPTTAGPVAVAATVNTPGLGQPTVQDVDPGKTDKCAAVRPRQQGPLALEHAPPERFGSYRLAALSRGLGPCRQPNILIKPRTLDLWPEYLAHRSASPIERHTSDQADSHRFGDDKRRAKYIAGVAADLMSSEPGHRTCSE